MFLTLASTDLVITPKVRGMCRLPYPGHPKGCPNWNLRSTCPPEAKPLGEVLDLSQEVTLVYTIFDLADHVDKLRQAHPGWSDRQLNCCLYWQGGARKKLREEVGVVLKGIQQKGSFLDGYETEPKVVLYCPEACGLNVTETMARQGIILEWPPVTVTYQVALIGNPVNR